jgi:hypothetical protein
VFVFIVAKLPQISSQKDQTKKNASNFKTHVVAFNTHGELRNAHTILGKLEGTKPL